MKELKIPSALQEDLRLFKIILRNSHENKLK